MKVRDSGIPDEEMWADFINPVTVLNIFGLTQGVRDLVEFGCSYGTFTLAAASIDEITVHALDIEPEMVRVVEQKCRKAGINNVLAIVHDFVAEGTGLADNSMDAALRVLKPNGALAVIHWNYAPSTPRGPAMEIRPRPEQCVAWGWKPDSVSTI